MGDAMVNVVKKPGEPADVQDASAPTAGQAGPAADDLAALSAEAAALEAGAMPGPVPVGQAVVSDNLEAEVLSALQMARLAAGSMLKWWPDFKAVWSDDALRNIAAAGAEVMRRHGWSMGELMSSWGPYIALVGAIAPPAMVTYQAIQERKEEERRAANLRTGGLASGGESATPA
jgi:hypothetical protein